MFDTYLAVPRQSAPVVHVHQQPLNAADAARLHGEIRKRAVEEARNEVLTALIEQLGARNCIKIVSVDHERSVEDLSDHVRAIFEINGERFDIKAKSHQEIGRQVIETVGRAVLDQIMRELMRTSLAKPR